MNKGTIIRLPIKYSKIIKNRRGIMSVDCIVTDRWLKFSNNSTRLDCGEVCVVDVMTTNTNGMDKKICQLVLKKEELVGVINRIKCSN